MDPLPERRFVLGAALNPGRATRRGARGSKGGEVVVEQRHRVVVIGSGFGGLTATKALKNAPVDVTMVARTQHHLFQPLLYQVATGILSEGEIAPATRRILRNQPNAQVLLGDVVEINLAERYVVSELLGHHYETAYDSLIVAA